MDVSLTDGISDEQFLPEVDRILRSETLRTSEVLRRLFKFLAEKSMLGEADQLKEYTVGIDALEKPSTYDPRQDSSVRIHVGRLRQKLAEYYRTEGKDDLTIIDLPKGRFKLTCVSRVQDEAIASNPEKTRRGSMPVWIVGLMGFALLMATAWGAYATIKLRHMEASLPPSKWNADLEELWQPFLETNRPLLLAVEDQLFAEFKGKTHEYFGDNTLDAWDDVLRAPGAQALRKILKNSTVEPNRTLTSLGSVKAAFLLGRLFGTRGRDLSLIRTSELSWQQLADNNVLFVGYRPNLRAHLTGMTSLGEPEPNWDGDQHSASDPNGSKAFLDRYLMAPTEQGEVYAIVTHLPGPLGNGDIESFTSDRFAGYVGAIQWFTDPASAHILTGKLRQPSGKIPRYYQVVFKIRFKDQVPTETSFVVARELK